LKVLEFRGKNFLILFLDLKYYFQISPLFFKKGSSFGSLPRNFFKLLNESLVPPGARIYYLYLLPISLLSNPASLNFVNKSAE